MTIDKNMNVLVVDDYPTMVRIVRNILMSLGFSNIDEASEGGDALTKMGLKSYDLIISDLNMEAIDGLDFFKEIRKQGNMVPFIMVTAEKDLKDARKAGIKSFIAKPVDEPSLKGAIESYFGKL